MKRLIFILLLVICCSMYTSNTEARPYLQSGTNRQQITFGTLGMTFGGLAGVAVGTAVEKTLNDHFFNEKTKKLSFISYGLGYLVATELCTRGIEFGYRIKNDKDYRGSRRETRQSVGIGIPIATLGLMAGAVGILGIGMQPGSASNSPDATILLLPIAIIVIPAVCLTLPSFLGARSYNKSLKKKPIEAEINILRVAF